MSEKKKEEKSKITFYLSQEGLRLLNEIYTGRLLAGVKVDRSRVAFDALNLLHAKEVKGAKNGQNGAKTEEVAGNMQGATIKKPQARKKTIKSDEE